jgi:hypothetical protein
MAVQPYPYLVMTDGTDTVTFADGAGGVTNYPPVRGAWSPAIAGIRTSQLGGRGPYADVEEDLSCNIRDTTAALCWSRLDTLARLLDKAERWWLKNENISPVILKYAPQGSTIHSNATPMQAIVLGRVGTDELNGVDLPSNVNDAGMLFEIYGVKVACMRRGAWGGASESASAGAVANPAVLSVTMPSSPTLQGSLKVDFTGFTTAAATGNIEIPSGYVFLGPNNSMSLLEGEAATAGGSFGTFASVADAAARASGGSVGRVTSTAGTPGTEMNLTWTLPAAFATATRVAIFCAYRANNANGWTLTANADVGVRFTTTPQIAIPAAVSPYPQTLYLGEMNSPYGFTRLMLNVASATSAAGNTIDFDTLVVLDMSANQTFVVAQSGITQFALGASFASKNTQLTVTYDPLTLRSPLVNAPILTTALTVPLSYSGDAAWVQSGGTIQVMWYATHLWNGATPYWTTQNVTGAAKLSIGCTITRRLSYLSPQ